MKTKSSKTVPISPKLTDIVTEPRPQIPQLMQSLTKSCESCCGALDALEIKIAPVMNPDSRAIFKPVPPISGPAPLAEQLTDAVNQIKILNSRLRTLTSRVEL